MIQSLEQTSKLVELKHMDFPSISCVHLSIRLLPVAPSVALPVTLPVAPPVALSTVLPLVLLVVLLMVLPVALPVVLPVALPVLFQVVAPRSLGGELHGSACVFPMIRQAYY